MRVYKLYHTAQVKTQYLKGVDIWIEDWDSTLATAMGSRYEDTLEEVLERAQDAFDNNRKVFI